VQVGGKMDAIQSYQTLTDFQRTTRRYIPAYRTLSSHRRENIKSNFVYMKFIKVYLSIPEIKILIASPKFTKVNIFLLQKPVQVSGNFTIGLI
jgi:hypothetical protein